MRNSLPSLNALKAFESVARHLSMTLAGQELHVTPGAISLHIRELERQLGLPLFQRNGRKLALTASGQGYYYSIASAFSLMREATETLVQETQKIPSRWPAPPDLRLTGYCRDWLILNVPVRRSICASVPLPASSLSPRMVSTWPYGMATVSVRVA